MYDLVIVGGGAAGLMTAIASAGNNMKIAVLERNNAPCKKLYATGNGHCNYLNENADKDGFVRAYLEGIGIIGVTEDDGRVYPRNKEASSVVNALVNGCKRRGIEILCDCHVTDMKKTAEGFRVLSKDGRKFDGKALVIATGGKAGIQYGSYGEGYRWAQLFGHSLVKPVPALCAMLCSENIEKLHGVRVKGRVSLLCNDEPVSSDFGEIQFTKDSISGICVMNLSRFVRLSEDKKYTLSIDMYPEYSIEELISLFMHQIKASGCAMDSLVPEKIHNYLHTRIEPSMHNPKTMAALSKNLCFNITGTKGWADAQVSSGGVPLDEINPDTMESKKVDGLYFAGEITDYDGPCGGYNLTNAWKNGIKAGKAINAKLDR